MSTSRQLAAIVFADIQGYTAMMQQDESTALTLRNKFQKILEQEIKLHGGRIAIYSGDGAMCVFKSAIGAVNAAIAVQHKMLEEPKVPVRLGIHIGDVVTEGKNVFGDGVNIASRIESFAVPGAVFISSKVADEIRNKREFSLVSMGNFELKNVAEPLEIFAIHYGELVIPDGGKLTGKGKKEEGKKKVGKRWLIGVAAFLLIVALLFLYFKKKSPVPVDIVSAKTIAVLPFSNLSSQKDDEYFADGVCDQILTGLSKISALNVLSRTSTLQFRDTKLPMKEISQQIGADILLEGSVQKSGDKIRINVQLIDAIHDKHLWAETYDRDMKDVFAVQSDIANQIAEALNTTLTGPEQMLFSAKPTDNMEAFDVYLRANKESEDFWRTSRMDRVPEAVSLFEKSIQLDPTFAYPYGELVALYTEISFRKPVTNYEDYRMKAKEWLDKLTALKLNDPYVHSTIALYKYEGERDYSGALAQLDLVDQYFRNDKQTIDMRGYVLRRMGRLDEAVRYFIRHAQAYPKNLFVQADVSETYAVLRMPDSAIYYADKTLQLRPDRAGSYILKASIFSDLKGDLETSKRIMKEAAHFTDTSELASYLIYLDMLRGDYGSAIHRLNNQKDSIYVLSQGSVKPNNLVLAILYNNQGNHVQAKTYFQKSLEMLDRLVKKSPEDFRMHSALGVAYAGLGQREKALEEGTKARDMMPLSVDAIVGLSQLENLALIHLLLNEEDAAIDILEQLLKSPLGFDTSNSKPLYKTHPNWKLLQKNERFLRLIQD
jgi:adenylate cyclase